MLLYFGGPHGWVMTSNRLLPTAEETTSTVRRA